MKRRWIASCWLLQVCACDNSGTALSAGSTDVPTQPAYPAPASSDSTPVVSRTGAAGLTGSTTRRQMAGPPTSSARAGAAGTNPAAAAGMSGTNDWQDGDRDAGVTPGPSGTSGTPDASEAQTRCPPLAYVSNSGADTVSVIDTNTHKVVATIPTDKAPVNPTFTPDRTQVYVANSQASTISIIDVATNTATTMPAGGERPSGLAFSPDGKTLYVSLISQDYTSPGSVHSIDLLSGSSSQSIPMGADPERIALTPDGKRLYINNLLDGTMAVVDTQAHAVVKMLTLGDLPFNPLMAPDGATVYVGVMSANHIAVIDTESNEVTRTVPADSPNGIAPTRDFQTLYVSNALSGTVQEVSLATSSIVQTQMVGGLPGNIALLPDGEHLYMVRPEGTTVEVLDAETLAIVDTITVEAGPSVVTICRDY